MCRIKYFAYYWRMENRLLTNISDDISMQCKIKP